MASTFSIRCRASDDLLLAMVDGAPVLAKADTRDDRQLWFKDMRYGAGVTDEEGSPAFALVNKATGEALKHSFGFRSPVCAIKFYPAGYLDASVLWAESQELLGDGFRRIHMINNTDYIFDAEEGTPDFGGARQGTRLILFRWNGGPNQQWRITPYEPASPAPVAVAPLAELPEHARSVRILCQSGKDLCLTVRDGAVVLARTGHKDARQRWMQSFGNTGNVTDGKGHRAFLLVNWATGNALGHCLGVGSEKLVPVRLVGHNPDSVDVSLLWTRGNNRGEGFHNLRTVSDTNIVLDAANGGAAAGGAHDGTAIIIFPWNRGANQKWKILPFL